MNTKPVQLEKVFLLNALLYVDSIESVKKFIKINTKCQEVSTMVRLYTKRKRRDSDDPNMIYEKKMIPRNLFAIFPKIETIECDFNDLINYPEIMEKVAIIRLKEEEKYDDWIFMEEIDNSFEDEISKDKKKDEISKDKKKDEEKKTPEEKVIAIRCLASVDKGFLNMFKYCTHLSIDASILKHEIENIKNLQLDKLIVYHKGKDKIFDVWSNLKTMKNIKEKILFIEYTGGNLNQYEAFKEEMKEYFDTVSFHSIDKFIPDEYYDINTKQIDLDEFSIQFEKDHPNVYFESIECEVTHIWNQSNWKYGEHTILKY